MYISLAIYLLSATSLYIAQDLIYKLLIKIDNNVIIVVISKWKSITDNGFALFVGSTSQVTDSLIFSLVKCFDLFL